MANVNVRFSASLVDDLGTTASTVAYTTLPDTATLAGVATAWGNYASKLDAVTDAAITGGRVDLLQSFTGADKGAGAGNPKVGSRVEQTGVVNFSSAGTRHRWGFPIPGLANAAIVLGKLDLTNADITALISMFTSAVAGGTFTNPNSQNIGALVDAILSFRERRKQLQRSSFER